MCHCFARQSVFYAPKYASKVVASVHPVAEDFVSPLNVATLRATSIKGRFVVFFKGFLYVWSKVPIFPVVTNGVMLHTMLDCHVSSLIVCP